MKWIRDFFSTGNEINENTVMGVCFSAALLAGTFTGIVDGEKYYVLAGMIVAFFGVGALKK